MTSSGPIGVEKSSKYILSIQGILLSQLMPA